MLAESIKTPENYLEFFNARLTESNILEKHLSLKKYFFELNEDFKRIYYQRNINEFTKWRQMLSIDAELQILLDLIDFLKNDMDYIANINDKDVINIIQKDKESYYRELTGKKINDHIHWGLIYMSEK